VQLITATRSKGDRSVPVVGLYEQFKVLHHGIFPELESEMRTFVPGETNVRRNSPNRLDALVHLIYYLLLSIKRAGSGFAIRKII
jgi:phage terminase large subunit-like protein